MEKDFSHIYQLWKTFRRIRDKTAAHAQKLDKCPFSLWSILVPRGLAPFGQHQESRPLAWSNTGNPRFTDFPSLCAWSESSLTNLIGFGLTLLCLQSHSKPECRWIRPEVAISWCWPKGVRPLGTRMLVNLNLIYQQKPIEPITSWRYSSLQLHHLQPGT